MAAAKIPLTAEHRVVRAEVEESRTESYAESEEVRPGVVGMNCESVFRVANALSKRVSSYCLLKN